MDTTPPPASAEPVIRTVLGDLPASALGPCDAHEHIIIDGPYIAERFPDLLLNDLAVARDELSRFRASGGGWVVDTMPTGAGRDAAKLFAAAHRTGVPIVCPTGLHLAKYYPSDHPLLSMDRDALSALFAREITEGVCDKGRPLGIAAGVIKVAGGADRLDDLQREAFIAAARAQAQIGCPIITHCEGGTAGPEQVRLLERHGADLRRVVLSHCDKIDDTGYHRELLSSGVCLEYDQHCRQLGRGEPCVAAELIRQLGPGFPDQIVVGMDIARRRYWPGYGGGPGLAWLMTDLPAHLAAAGVEQHLAQRILGGNPQRAFAFGRQPADT